VKQWRQRRKDEALLSQRQMIQDEIPAKKPLFNPLFKLILLIPGGLRREMIQDEILFQRVDRRTFMATGGGR